MNPRTNDRGAASPPHPVPPSGDSYSRRRFLQDFAGASLITLIVNFGEKTFTRSSGKSVPARSFVIDRATA